MAPTEFFACYTESFQLQTHGEDQLDSNGPYNLMWRNIIWFPLHICVTYRTKRMKVDIKAHFFLARSHISIQLLSGNRGNAKKQWLPVIYMKSDVERDVETPTDSMLLASIFFCRVLAWPDICVALLWCKKSTLDFHPRRNKCPFISLCIEE